MRPTTAMMALAVTIVGCGGARWLPSTLFHATLAPSIGEPSEAAWAQLALASPHASATSVAATTSLGADAWIVWTTDLAGHGAIMRVRRSALGLEAQSFGAHDGPSNRATLRALRVDAALVIVAESSSSTDSTERHAWLLVEDGSQIVPLMLLGVSAEVAVRGELRRPLERGWSRAAIFTATFEARPGAIVVHEHESVREVSAERPELVARSSYEVERARTLALRRTDLVADRASLFDDPD